MDHLTRVYAYTAQHVLRAKRLAEALGYSSLLEVGNGEDILLSFSGESCPVAHPIGSVLQCASSALFDVATWTSGGEEFFVHRDQLHERLSALTQRPKSLDQARAR